MIKKYGIAIYFFFLCFFLCFACFYLGYSISSEKNRLGSFDGTPVYAKMNGSRVEVSFSDKPMQCKGSIGKPINNCDFIPVVIDLNELKLTQ